MAIDTTGLEIGQPATNGHADAPPVQAFEPPQRTITDRLSLGHVAMIAAGLLAFVLVMAVLRDRTETASVATAAQEILPGATVTSDMVTYIHVPADSELVGTVADAETIAAGSLTAGHRIGPGEPLTLSALTPASAPSGLRAMSIPIDRDQAVGGDIGAGDRVDVIAVGDTGATYVATDLEVLATQSASSRVGALGSAGSGSYYVVVAVDDQTALGLALAVDVGGVSILRSTGAQSVPEDQRSLAREPAEQLLPVPSIPQAETDE